MKPSFRPFTVTATLLASQLSGATAATPPANPPANPLNLAAITGDVCNPSLSPDGSHIAFQKRTPQGWRIFVAAVNGTGQTMVSQGPRDDVEPDWRSDGAAIAFASNRSGNFDLFQVRPDGGALRQLTATATDERNPQWSPRPFGLFERYDLRNHMQPDRPRANVAPSELKLLELLARDSDNWQGYDRAFKVKPSASYFKLLFVQGSGAKRRLATMREDSSCRQILETNLPGACLLPRWERGAQTMAFVRQNGASAALYLAGYPATLDLNHGRDKPNWGIDLAAWRESLQRVATLPQAEATCSWTPNGEYLAVGSPKALVLWPRPDSRQKPLTIPLSAPLTSGSLTWRPDARTVVFGVKSGNTASLRAQTLTAPLLDIVNLHDMEEIEDRVDHGLLAANSFVAGGQPAKQMFSIYEATDYDNMPIFVTSDSILHLNHLIFDYLLRETEKQKLTPVVIALTRHYLEASLQQMHSDAPAVRAAATRNAAFFSVAARLFLGEVTTGARQETPAPDDPMATDRAAFLAKKLHLETGDLEKWISPLRSLLATLPPEVKHLADKDMPAIRAHTDMAASHIFEDDLSVANTSFKGSDGTVNFTDFIPRGHYTHSEVLRRYFLATRWLAACPFRRTPGGIRAALLILQATDGPTRTQLDGVLKATSVFIGEADDAGIPSYARLSREVWGGVPSLAQIASDTEIKRFASRLEREPLPRIAATMGAAFRVLPQPATPDAEIMQALVFDGIPPDVGTPDEPRRFALGLDVAGVLGSDRAHQILGTTQFEGPPKETAYFNYEKAFNAQRAVYAKWTTADWNRNLYTRILYALLPLLTHPARPGNAFTQSPAWTDKDLNTALGTWAELKHDTLPKQAVSAEGGEESGLEEAPLWDQPRGYLEPVPEVFQRLSALVQAERSALRDAGYLTPDFQQRLDTFGALLAMLTQLENKQSRGLALNPREVEQLRFYAAYQEYLTIETMEGELRSLEDNDMAIIADVELASFTMRVLEEGVGRALPLYVAVSRDGHRELTRGAIFSYYEFSHPAADRLTDQKWRTMLDAGTAPKIPAWTHSFIR